MSHQPIAAISTANASGGIGIVRISGEGALTVASKVFTPVGGKTPEQMKGYTAAFGRVHDGDTDIDEAICLVFRAPKSYTGEDAAEISCHGGTYVTQRVLRAVLNAGAEPAQAGEFTKRAFLNGRIRLDEAEAVMQLISAQGEQASKAALNALDGAVSRRTDEISESLAFLSATLAAWVDYPYEEIEELEPQALSATLTEAAQGLRTLIRRFDSSRAVTEGVNTAIVGRPNTGKSTLMNLLSGTDCSIVTDIAGTTRDVVEQTVTVADVLLHLSDTAGIRPTSDEVESIGVERAKKALDRAELLLAVFDGSQPLCEEDRQLLHDCAGKKTVAILNKTDMGSPVKESEITALCPVCVRLSAKTGEGRQELEQAIRTLTGAADFHPSQTALTTERQRVCAEKAVECIEEAKDALSAGMTLDAVNVSIDDAIGHLNRLSGRTASEAVLDEVFSNFCVGK